MQRFRAMVFAPIAILGWCLTASAQLAELIDVSDPANKLNVFSINLILTKAEVQQELALTESQKQEFKRWQDERRALTRSQPRVFDVNDLNKEEHDQRLRDWEENQVKVAKGLVAVLDEAQKTRLAQLRLQELGSRALN